MASAAGGTSSNQQLLQPPLQRATEYQLLAHARSGGYNHAPDESLAQSGHGLVSAEGHHGEEICNFVDLPQYGQAWDFLKGSSEAKTQGTE
eukprot:CAMPEP_0174376290 /NCGR_PEP_ID=MMETSP0811_2-20130205/117680_1 /TAXON_ID=73025 ORGANISM="Eutreptiella gymnastica-like, Strain CCMP1594" /NCGR_SAMPLE_ID=MMETSP0811_2 /ASSEMBLY_ACC=CAM_ASM_000667 /LENGTH=90 /DNA_ID=CAMNT_0015527329 /DNA_START=150 /DNA_END=422 /DNA_ORIENTATION=+